MKQSDKTAPIRFDSAKTDSFTMDYFYFGSGKKTLVILPGLSIQSVMGSANTIARAYRQLTNDFTVYVFDRRKELPSTYPVCEMAEDTAQAFRAAGLERISVFGASQGGMIAMELAINHPELVQKMVLGSTTARITEADFQTVEHWIQLAQKKEAAALYLAFGEAIYPQKLFESAKSLFLDTAKTVTETDLARFIVLAQGMRHFDVSQRIKKITCPVLVLGDWEDRLLGAQASVQIKEALPQGIGAELYNYSGYGHAAYDLAPDYKARILQFLLQKET